jgi:hypothetical protein
VQQIFRFRPRCEDRLPISQPNALTLASGIVTAILMRCSASAHAQQAIGARVSAIVHLSSDASAQPFNRYNAEIQEFWRKRLSRYEINVRVIRACKRRPVVGHVVYGDRGSVWDGCSHAKSPTVRFNPQIGRIYPTWKLQLL